MAGVTECTIVIRLLETRVIVVVAGILVFSGRGVLRCDALCCVGLERYEAEIDERIVVGWVVT